MQGIEQVYNGEGLSDNVKIEVAGQFRKEDERVADKISSHETYLA